MRVVQLNAYIVDLPLKKPFRHASHERHSSTNFFVECVLDDGTIGWGEGVPRDYVTGETPESCLETLSQTPLGEQLTDDCVRWQDVLALVEGFQPTVEGDDPRGCRANALTAAVELSLLDAFGQSFGEPVSAIAAALPQFESIFMPTQSVRYSTTIDAEHARKLWKSALKMRLWGFHQCKVKVGSDPANDASRLRKIRRWIGPRVDIRIDVNEAWEPTEVATHVAELASCGVRCVEQPVAHEKLAELAAVKSEIHLPIMLDESLTSHGDAKQAVELGVCDLFNLRISKCGGFLACLRLAAMAREHGLGYQLGCHPGESGILSAAGRHWAAIVRDIRYLEGSYDHHVLRTLPTEQDITFGYGGRAKPLAAPGLGVSIDRAVFDPLVVERREFPL